MRVLGGRVHLKETLKPENPSLGGLGGERFRAYQGFRRVLASTRNRGVAFGVGPQAV